MHEKEKYDTFLNHFKWQMKGLITAAGLGTRSGLDGKLRKEMLPVYDVRDGKLVLRPIIDVIITNLKNSGVSEIGAVLDPSDVRTRDYLETEFPAVALMYQKEKRGFGHAVLMGRDFIGDDSFILNAGDGMVLNDSILPDMVRWPDNGVYLTLMEVDNPKKYGTADAVIDNGNIKIRAVVEKSETPPSNLGLCALYRLPAEIFESLSSHNERNIELTPSINGLIGKGVKTKAVKIERNEWISVGRAESYVEVLRATLNRCRDKIT